MGLSQAQAEPGAFLRRLAIVVAAATVTVLAGTAARADCQEDIGKLMKRRMDAVGQINKAKTASGKLDPTAACPRLKSLVVIEGEASAYMTKNQEWCNLPPEFVEKMSTSFKRTTGFAAQACSFAVKMKKMQEMQAQQQQQAAPKLPAGPL